jgi:hypothetical protein
MNGAVMAVTLESLELDAEKLEWAREEVRKLAHQKWVEAGQPGDGHTDFWLLAEREWIERVYVPDRSA